MNWFRREIASHFAHEHLSFGPRPPIERLKALEEAVIAWVNFLRAEKGVAPLVLDERFDRWIKTEGRSRTVTGRYSERDEVLSLALERYRVVGWTRLSRYWQEITYKNTPEEIAAAFTSRRTPRERFLCPEYRQIAVSAQMTRTGKVFLYIAVIY